MARKPDPDRPRTPEETQSEEDSFNRNDVLRGWIKSTVRHDGFRPWIRATERKCPLGKDIQETAHGQAFADAFKAGYARALSTLEGIAYEPIKLTPEGGKFEQVIEPELDDGRERESESRFPQS